MANLQVTDGGGVTKYLKESGAGTDQDPHVAAVAVESSALPTGAATAANQATEAATLASILAKLTADPATQTTLAAILAKIIAAPATEARQTTANTALGAPADAAVVSGSASIIAALKGLGVAVGGAAVTPSDSADLSTMARSLYVGTTGDLKLKLVDGSIVSFVAIPAGTVLPIAVLRVYATGQPGSIATNVVALY